MSKQVSEFLPILQRRIDTLRAAMGEVEKMPAIMIEARLMEVEFIHDWLRLWDSVEIDASRFYRYGLPPVCGGQSL
jgi:hypothetical protein